ncbi:MAG: hypothetical protein GX594_10610, partial [Pirellulaceae bacterium]|nr:hypothetical protein [Pirellulaceae bacterium]
MNATPHNMSERTSAELWGLASRYCNDMLDAADVARLETLLAEDAGARSFFGVYASMHAELTWRFRGGAIGETAGGDAAEPAVGPAVVIYPHRAASESSFVGDLAFSYMVASVFMCFLLLGFWAYKLPSDRGSSIASNENSRGLTGPGESSPDRPAPVFVGRVTGIAGAKWSDEPNYIAP